MSQVEAFEASLRAAIDSGTVDAEANKAAIEATRLAAKTIDESDPEKVTASMLGTYYRMLDGMGMVRAQQKGQEKAGGEGDVVSLESMRSRLRLAQ